MADEMTDTSNREQLVICLRWVDDDLIPHENFIDIQKVEKIDPAIIKSVILDVLVQESLHAAGQCYDGCGTRCGTGAKVGVVPMIKEIAQALSHKLYPRIAMDTPSTFPFADTTKHCTVVKDALETTHEISKLIKCSPKTRRATRDFEKEY